MNQIPGPRNAKREDIQDAARKMFRRKEIRAIFSRWAGWWFEHWVRLTDGAGSQIYSIWYSLKSTTTTGIPWRKSSGGSQRSRRTRMTCRLLASRSMLGGNLAVGYTWMARTLLEEFASFLLTASTVGRKGVIWYFMN